MPQKIDLTGQVFGRLTVLKEEIPKKTKRVRWICQCECGTIKPIGSNELRSGKTLSCGCLRNEKVRQAIGNKLEGKRFGRLTVLKQVDSIQEQSGALRTAWLCECSCGNQVVVKTINLKNGDTKSCGCQNLDSLSQRKKDLTGIRFGRLVALEIDEEKMENRKDYDTRAYWRCKCDCGNFTTVSANYLIQGHTNSCGCIHSIGEEKIGKILTESQISFQKEYSFSDLLGNKKPLRFDFAIFDEGKIKYLIEYQGEQHFHPIEFFGGVEQFITQQAYDNQKKKYCEDNNIPLVLISYLDLKKVDINMIKERYNEAKKIYGYRENEGEV